MLYIDVDAGASPALPGFSVRFASTRSSGHLVRLPLPAPRSLILAAPSTSTTPSAHPLRITNHDRPLRVIPARTRRLPCHAHHPPPSRRRISSSASTLPAYCRICHVTPAPSIYHSTRHGPRSRVRVHCTRRCADIDGNCLSLRCPGRPRSPHPASDALPRSSETPLTPRRRRPPPTAHRDTAADTIIAHRTRIALCTHPGVSAAVLYACATRHTSNGERLRTSIDFVSIPNIHLRSPAQLLHTILRSPPPRRRRCRGLCSPLAVCLQKG